jgi:hypothetical protein
VEGESIVQKVDDVFTEEALRANDGKTVPLTREFGGPVIGEATLKYDEDEKALKADFNIDEITVPGLVEFLKGPPPCFILRDPYGGGTHIPKES